ncbi:transcription factor that binds to CRE motif [Pleosporales sp. CAS-2024a]
MASGPMTPPTHDLVPTTIKMEDLQVPFDTPSPAPSAAQDRSQVSSTPSTTNSEGKPVKKRKSWGQVLPEPKTSLPPRKRAKTEDEKEQRRIERVKRNRLAAHNSRERKRQEYEVLQAEKDQMEADLKSFKERMAQMEAELSFFRRKYPGEAPESVFDLSPATNDRVDTICPARTSASFPSPVSMDSMDSPRDSSCQPETPASAFEAATPEFDSTQYPAAIFGLSSIGSDLGLSHLIQSHSTEDEKPIVLDNLFDFDQFPEASSSLEQSQQPTFGMVDSHVDLFGGSLVGYGHSSNPFGFPDGFDAKFSDLQSASGATFVSDEALAAEL